MFADKLSQKLGFIVDNGIIQINQVGHTGSDGFGRLARQPVFEGNVIPGQDYLMVDDFVGMGGTLANLRGYIESKGGKVIAATVLTGKQYSAKIALNHDTSQNLRDKHGRERENGWQERFGHAFDSLTQSEARYLLKTGSADRIREKIVAAEQG
ncbi:MAG: phosphoribosyltransferase [Desulfatirhabdiaceae bacterium]